ncbi:MAG: Calx-beta domain-containing protein, partial [Roseobacter sp.]
MLPTLSISSAQAVELDGTITFTVQLSAPSFSDVTLQYRAVQNGSAVVGSNDLDSSTADDVRTLTIPAGSINATIQYSVNRSTIDEFDENFTVELFDIVNAEFANGGPILQTTGVILDDDGGSFDRALFVSDPVLYEGDGPGQQARFEIRLSEPFAVARTFDFNTVDGSARAGSDYVANSGAVTFLPGQTVKFVDVNVFGDLDAETLETFSLVVTPRAPLALDLTDSTGVAELVDDDTSSFLPEISVSAAEMTEVSGEITFRVLLSEPSLGTITVQYRAVQSGSAVVGSNDLDSSTADDVRTLTIAAGETEATIQYSVNRSTFDEFDENFTLELFDPTNAVLSGNGPVLQATGVILDDDGGSFDRALFVSDPVLYEGNGPGQQARFEVRLSEAFSTDITLDYTTRDGSALAGSDYGARSGTLTFQAGQTIAFVDVPVFGDVVAETLETFSLVVTQQSPLTLNMTDSSGIAEIIDGDTSTFLPEISVSAAEMTEVSGEITFRVLLSEPSLGTITVQYRAVQNGSAVVGSNDLDSSTADDVRTLTIAAGETEATIQYSVNRSTFDEFDENFTLELFDPTNAVLSGNGPVLQATGVILDDDGGSFDRALFVSDPVLYEGNGPGQQARFEVRLSEAFSTDITLDYTTRDG